MNQEILLAAERLLQEPQELHEIPIHRATNALGVSSLTLRGSDHSFGDVVFLYSSNLYLYFDGHAPTDAHGNYDSPIFQNSSYNGYKPLWQEFRERAEAKIGTSVSHIFFGDYVICDNHKEEFTVKSEPKDCRWRYTKKPTKHPKNSVFITPVSAEEALEYQAILDELRYERAIKIIQDRHDRIASRACSEEAITALNSKYTDEFDRFTFDTETFRFRQFQTEFLYTSDGLAQFNDFYEKVCIPYRQDEISEAEWREKTHQLENILMHDDEFGPEFRLSSVHGFKLTRRPDGSCEVESDLTDDRTGRPLLIVVKSQKFDDILNAVTAELAIVFRRKRQVRQAAADLQTWASQK